MSGPRRSARVARRNRARALDQGIRPITAVPPQSRCRALPGSDPRTRLELRLRRVVQPDRPVRSLPTPKDRPTLPRPPAGDRTRSRLPPADTTGQRPTLAAATPQPESTTDA